MAVCNSKTKSCIENQLSKCLEIIRKYEWLHSTLLHDFFVEKHWESIPKGWRSSLHSLSPIDLSNFLNYWEQNDKSDHPNGTILPLELLALKFCVSQYSIERQPVKNVNEALNLANLSERKLDVTTGQRLNTIWKSYEEELSSKGKQHKNLQHVFRKHVKPKKQHEIARLGSLVKSISESTNITQIVDVGSGVGHLSRLLAYAHNLKTVSIDAKDNFVESAQIFDDQLVQQLKKKDAIKEKEITKFNEQRNGHASEIINSNSGPFYLEKHIDFNDKQSFLKLLSSYHTDNTEFGIVGLHTCGDLAPAIVKFYAECKEAKILSSVACCYMRITSTFPMSQSISSIPTLHTCPNDPIFSYLSKELSCHAFETYVNRLRTEEDSSKLKVHCYRALLELLIDENDPKLRHSALKSVPKSHLLSFQEYAEKATKDLDIKFDFKNERVVRRINMHLEEWWHVVIYYSLRLLFAPLIETVILLDRSLFLLEHGHDSSLVPIFDPSQSPRNHVLISVKNSIK